MLTFRLDVYAWIPLPDVPNPIHSLPGGVARWGPGACGPRFGGDDFVIPPATYAGYTRTYRAMQTFAFQALTFGSPPTITLNPGVRPGLTTVLTAPRRSGGSMCHSLTPTVTASAASATWNAADHWYEAKMHGAAHDPVPAAAAAHILGPHGRTVGAALTPDLEWDATVRFQSGTSVPATTRARYALSSALRLDVSATTFPTPASFGGATNLVHGIIMVRRFPSYVLYVTIDTGTGGGPVTVPLYFADAASRGLGEIVIGQHDPLRQLTW